MVAEYRCFRDLSTETSYGNFAKTVVSTFSFVYTTINQVNFKFIEMRSISQSEKNEWKAVIFRKRFRDAFVDG